MTRPTVKTRCVAQTYAGPHERIIEFFDRATQSGGLISFFSSDAGLKVEVYRTDPKVTVLAPASPQDEEKDTADYVRGRGGNPCSRCGAFAAPTGGLCPSCEQDDEDARAEAEASDADAGGSGSHLGRGY